MKVLHKGETDEVKKNIMQEMLHKSMPREIV